jgi:glycosyltransferase involved in cell wall biosynthesis
LPAFVDHIIVVDDASSDRTAEAARATNDPRLTVLRTPHNLGVGGATIEGYRRALDLDCAIAVKMDGDAQMRPEYLPALLDAIIGGGYDYAKGNRFLTGDALAVMPRSRLIGNIVMTLLTKLASGYWHIFDPQNGYTAIRAEALSALDLDAIHRGYFFENDMLVHLNLGRRRVKDVAIPAYYGDEKSDLNFFHVFLTFPPLLFQRYWRRIYRKYVLVDFSPIALFLFVGLLLFGWGMGFGFWIWWNSAHTHVPTPTGTIMLSLLPLILGFQLILEAIVLDIQETPR